MNPDKDDTFVANDARVPEAPGPGRGGNTCYDDEGSRPISEEPRGRNLPVLKPSTNSTSSVLGVEGFQILQPAGLMMELS